METLAVVEMPLTTGFPEDVFVNTFSVDLLGESMTISNFEQLRTHLANFYNANQSTGSAVKSYLAHGIDRTANACSVKWYDVSGDLAGTPHGSPLHTGTWTLGAAFGSAPDLPAEVAFCLSLKAEGRDGAAVESDDGSDPGGAVDRPMQRRTGRIYLGPLNSIAVDTGVPYARPSEGLRAVALAAAEDLYTDFSNEGWEWSVWSRSDSMFRPVVGAFVDNAFDSQRRRGVGPTIRTTETF